MFWIKQALPHDEARSLTYQVLIAKMLQRILKWPKSAKRAFVMGLDTAMALVAMWVAFSLRLDTLHMPSGMQWWVYGLAPLLALPVFVQQGLYRAMFRHNGMRALITTGRAVAIYGLVLFLFLLLAQWPTVPRSVGVLQPLVFLLLVGTSRTLGWRLLASSHPSRASHRLLIYGAGSAGVQTADGLAGTRQYLLLGFVDDDASKVGRSINGTSVYAPQSLPKLIEKLHVTEVLLALPSASSKRRREIIAQLSALPVRVRTLPGLTDLASGRVTVQDFQDLDIEDLLGRTPVAPEPALLDTDLRSGVVMVTGAGGSIGSELCRQIVRLGAQRLVLIDHSEYALYTVHQELQAIATTESLACELVPILANVTHEQRMLSLCKTYKPGWVYHAAAYKHVPMVEANAAEGVMNNVFGTLNVVKAAVQTGVAHFVLISTDKAVRPTSVMGASKRTAELVLQAIAAATHNPFAPVNTPAAKEPWSCPTRLAAVRFGNVLGSSGSVIPLFRRQIAQGGPITMTHPEVTRYFMTLQEAAQLVLQAGTMAEGGDVFVLDMGTPVKILDLAKRMVMLSGHTLRDTDHPGGDIDIVFIGLRPGEKLYEELLIGDNPQPTAHPQILKAHEKFQTWPVLVAHLEALHSAVVQGDTPAIKVVLQQTGTALH